MKRLLALIVASGLAIAAAGCAQFSSPPPAPTSRPDTSSWMPAPKPGYFDRYDNTDWPRDYMGGF